MQKYLKKIKTWGKEYWPIGVLLLISVAVYHKWLSFGIFSNADYGFSFSETLRDFLHYSAWDAQLGFGSPNLVLWMWVWKFLPGFFGIFGLNNNIWDKFLFFWPFAFLTPIFAYLLAKQVLKNKIGAFVAALAFSFNTYYLAINTQGHLSLSLAGTFALLAIYFFWGYFENGKKKMLIVSALICLIVGGYDFRVMYILFFILLASPLWFLSIQKGIMQKKIFFRQHFPAVVFFFGLLFIFNLFWLWPTAITGSLADNEIIARDLVDNNFYLDLKKALTLFHPFWNGSEPKWFDDQKTPVYFWLIPIMALLGAYFQRKNRKIIFWFFVALLAVFFSKQDALPIKNAYIWMHQNFPGFNAYREASKFYFVTALSYSILIGAFVAHIFEYYAKKKFLKYSVYFFASLVFLWNVKPILTGEMHSIFTPREIPTDELIIRNYISLQNGSFRTLWNPKDSKWASYSTYRPKLDTLETRKSQWKSIKDYDNLQGGELSEGEANKLFFSENFAPQLLSESSVRYLISNKESFFMIEELVSNSGWKKIDLDLSRNFIFENKKVRPRIYFTDEIETIHQNLDFQNVEYSLKNSSRWNFTLKNLEGPIWVNFSEKYHPDWQIVCGDTPWYALIRKRSILPIGNHHATDAGLNAFFLEPDELRKICKIDSGGNINLSLYYRPQTFLYLGGIISLSAIFLSLFTLVFWKEKGHNRNIIQKEKDAK